MGTATKHSGAQMPNSPGEHSNPFRYHVKEEKERASSGSWTGLPGMKHFLLNSALSAFLNQLELPGSLLVSPMGLGNLSAGMIHF